MAVRSVDNHYSNSSSNRCHLGLSVQVVATAFVQRVVGQMHEGRVNVAVVRMLVRYSTEACQTVVRHVDLQTSRKRRCEITIILAKSVNPRHFAIQQAVRPVMCGRHNMPRPPCRW